ncbi:WD40-repeat-containing domain protein [Chlamydoabsidia padenii]|nr:WD40-repeat-containing domain protein [Chlamydoabsidia padenii]
MLLSLSIPPHNLPSVQPSPQNTDTTTQDDITVMNPIQDTTKVYPLSTATTPPSVLCSAFNSMPNSLEDSSLTKECCNSLSNPRDRTPRKRTVTYCECILPYHSSCKRSRTISNNDSISTIDTLDNTHVYFYTKDNNTPFPSPTPTPTLQHPPEHPKPLYHQKQRQKQKQKQQQQALLSLQQTIDNPSVIKALWDMPNLINTFDTLSADMKTYLIFQLLKRSSRSSLKFVNSIIVPVIKRDILASLPYELSLQVIRYLDVRSLCRAATVSKTWRSIVDNDPTTWRSLTLKDGLDDAMEDSGSMVSQQESSSQKSCDGARSDNNNDDNHGSSSNNGGHDSNNDNENSRNNDDNSGNSNNNNDQNSNVDKPNTLADIDNDDDNEEEESNDKDASMINKGKKRPLSPTNNSHKDDYRKRHILRDNWRRGRFKRICFPGHNDANGFSVVTCLQFDDDKIISGVDDRVINIYETKTGNLTSTLRGHEGGVWALQYLGNTLVSGSTDRTIRVWDIERGVCTHVFLGHTSTVRCLQIVTPTMVDGKLEPAHPLIVTGSRDSTLKVWRLPDPRTDLPFDGNGVNPWYMHNLTGHTQSVRAISAHGNTLMSGSYDGLVNIWNLGTGRLVHRMEGHTQKVYAVVIDPVRRRCISGSMDGSIRVWDYVSGQCLQILEGHTALVGLLGLSKDYLISGAADGTLRTWNPDNGVCLNVLSGHDAAITCFQHDDEKVISGSEGVLKMWDVKTGRYITDLITGVTGVWRTAFDKRRCVAAVHRNEVTSFEVLDFGPDDSNDLDGEQNV